MSHIVKTVSERKEMQHVEYGIEFQAIGKEEGCGCRFPCNKDGTLIHDENFNIWFQNYKYCLSHPELFENRGVVKASWWYTEPAHAICSCGEEILLQGDTMCPKCGQWYNAFGQALKNPDEWEDDRFDGDFIDDDLFY